MDTREILIKQLNRDFKISFYYKIVRLIPLIMIIVISPIIIIKCFQNKDIFLAIFLFIVDIVIFMETLALIKKIRKNTSFYRSNLYQCILSTEKVSEIVVNSEKITFEIIGMENETVLLKDSDYRREILSNIKTVFGDNKIVNITN